MKISNLRFLENIEEIKKLKYSYFQACDVNNLDQIKRTFATENLNIDFENFGSFNDIESFLEQYKKKSIKENQVECHYGKNPVFKKIDNSILGVWALDYYLFQTRKLLMTSITGSYEDLYILEDSSWVIKKSKFRRSSIKTFDVSHGIYLKKTN
ncbi:nuclear transport factor 2 family protein [Gammaproteobacteria bacterium]|nr:nuclear transport factor 2 family protein [Gammaproteobacteria bacterium]